MRRQALIGLTAATALALPGLAFANTGGAAGVNTLPSQRIINSRPNGSGASLGISPARVRRVQQALNRLGYNAGTITGSWNQATSRATQDFQAAHNLAPTGNLNATTLAALGIGRRGAAGTAGAGGTGYTGAGGGTAAGNNVGGGGNTSAGNNVGSGDATRR